MRACVRMGRSTQCFSSKYASPPLPAPRSPRVRTNAATRPLASPPFVLLRSSSSHANCPLVIPLPPLPHPHATLPSDFPPAEAPATRPCPPTREYHRIPSFPIRPSITACVPRIAHRSKTDACVRESTRVRVRDAVDDAIGEDVDHSKWGRREGEERRGVEEGELRGRAVVVGGSVGGSVGVCRWMGGDVCSAVVGPVRAVFDRGEVRRRQRQRRRRRRRRGNDPNRPNSLQ